MPAHDDYPADTQVPWTLLARYLAGECGRSEEAAVAHWIAADPANALLLHDLRQIWAASDTPAATLDVEGFLRRVKRGRPPLRLADDAPTMTATPLRRPVRITPLVTPIPARRGRSATVLVAAVAAGLLVWTWRSAPLLVRAPAVPQHGTVVASDSRVQHPDPTATALTPRDVTSDGDAVSRCLP